MDFRIVLNWGRFFKNSFELIVLMRSPITPPHRIQLNTTKLWINEFSCSFMKLDSNKWTLVNNQRTLLLFFFLYNFSTLFYLPLDFFLAHFWTEKLEINNKEERRKWLFSSIYFLIIYTCQKIRVLCEGATWPVGGPFAKMFPLYCMHRAFA